MGAAFASNGSAGGMKAYTKFTPSLVSPQIIHLFFEEPGQV